jgi:hypothetical protein
MGLFNVFKKDKADSAPESPRKHHYYFAYKALPGLAFTAPNVPLGFATNIPEDGLLRFWQMVGTKLPENERLSGVGLDAVNVNFDSECLLLITLPPPLKKSEAYYVGILYPRSWVNSSFDNSKLPKPYPVYFILAMSDVLGTSGVTLAVRLKLIRSY